MKPKPSTLFALCTVALWISCSLLGSTVAHAAVPTSTQEATK